MGHKVNKTVRNADPQQLLHYTRGGHRVPYPSFHLVGPLQHDGQTVQICKVSKLLQKKFDEWDVFAGPAGPEATVCRCDVLCGPDAACNRCRAGRGWTLVEDLSVLQPPVKEVRNQLALEYVLS